MTTRGCGLEGFAEVEAVALVVVDIVAVDDKDVVVVDEVLEDEATALCEPVVEFWSECEGYTAEEAATFQSMV